MFSFGSKLIDYLIKLSKVPRKISNGENVLHVSGNINSQGEPPKSDSCHNCNAMTQ